MDLVIVRDDTPEADSRTRDLIEWANQRALVGSAWFLRHTRSTRYIRRPICALYESVLIRNASLRYKLSTEHEFESYRALLELPSVGDTGIHVSNRSYQSYEYDVLPDGGFFRCFELAPGDWNTRLSGRMIVHAFDEASDYEAISYTWSTAAPECSVDCGAGQISITSDVSALLRRLRLTKQSRRLWIDSICINQSDSWEKEAQVRLMSSIYSGCSRLVIWLGEEDKSTRHAIEMLKTLDGVVDYAWNNSHGDWPTFENLQAGGLPERTDSRWSYLATLLHSRWFTRTWILPEVSLAPSPWLQRGSFTFDWKKIVRILICLVRTRVTTFYNLNVKYAFFVSYFCSSRSWYRDPSLTSLLLYTRYCMSTLKVDRIFALLGLCAEKHDLQHLIRYSPDQAENVNDVKEVYTEFAAYFLSGGNLMILNLASDPSLRNLGRLPSWVPDWSSWCRAEPLLDFSFLQEPLFHMGSSTRISASSPRLSDDRTVLVLKGDMIDRVQRVGKRIPATRRMTDRAVALQIIKQWRQIAGKRSEYSSGETMDEAFARTVSLNMPVERIEQYDCADVYRRYMNQFPRSTWATAVSEDGEIADTFEFRGGLMTAIRLRTFFKTGRGFIGLGPYCLRPGDHIVDFDGASTPFAIRSTRNGRFKLVGEAYIHGLGKVGEGVCDTDIYLE